MRSPVRAGRHVWPCAAFIMMFYMASNLNKKWPELDGGMYVDSIPARRTNSVTRRKVRIFSFKC